MKLVQLLATLLFAACANSPATHEVPTDFCLTFARGGCYGTCPIYRTTVDARGAVTFTGKEYTAAVGKHERTMTSGDLEKLAAAIRAVGFFKLTSHSWGSPQCGVTMTDNPSTCITIRMNGREHTIAHNLGCRDFPGEKELIAFEESIDGLTGVGPWTRYDSQIERRRMLALQYSGGGCYSGVACEEAAAKLERESLLLMEVDDRKRHIANVVKIGRDRTVVLESQQFRFVREVRTMLSPARHRELAVRVASIPKPRGMPVVETPPDDLRYLADDRTWTNDARMIRIELMPAGKRERTIERWPAEDLVPFAQLTKRTFTRNEWNAIAARLEYHDRRGFADFRMLPGNVMLRVIATR